MPTPLELIPSTTSPEPSPTSKASLQPQLYQPSRAAVARMHALELEGRLEACFTYCECGCRVLKRLVSYMVSIAIFIFTSLVIRLGLLIVAGVALYYSFLLSLGKISGVKDPKLQDYFSYSSFKNYWGWT
ncbi:hypothetical protein Naga_100516g2 [Nannochloropsis gaditana]|uniref:Uncharacterized protein n=1 Tax=Nannochloropsis gaditana TaxID=72520 RepID=W7T8K4_9STRA|nr:hypothetical protein Naga_100516g2 [Nannochloropsis gaditana]